MRVVYWNNIPAPYMVDRFNALVTHGHIELEAWFSQRREPDRSWIVDESNWRFKHRYLGANSVRAVISAYRLLRTNPPDVLVCLYEKPEYVVTALRSRASGIPVVLHAMKTFDSQRPRRKRNELAKRFLFPRMSGFHVPGEDSADYVSHYGARPTSIGVFPEPVDVELFSSQTARSHRDETRRRLGVAGCVFLYVGRVWRHKGLTHLLEAFHEVATRAANVSLVIAGDGVDEVEYRSAAALLPKVRFTGYVQPAELSEIYAAADVFVFPTLGDTYGHVIQEAMAASLPVISTTAVGDIGDRVNEANGILVPPADSRMLAKAMLRLANDAELRRDMGNEGRSLIRGRTIEWWAKQFEDLVRDVATK